MKVNDLRKLTASGKLNICRRRQNVKKNVKMKKIVKRKKRLGVGRVIQDRFPNEINLWGILHELARIACALDTDVNLAIHQPYSMDLVSAVRKAFEEYKAREIRFTEERMVYVITEELHVIYKSAKDDKWNREKISLKLSELAEKYQLTFSISNDDVNALSNIPNQGKWDDTRGPKELAVLKMSDLLNAKKTTIYDVLKRRKTELGKRTTGLPFIDFYDLADFGKRVSVGLGFEKPIPIMSPTNRRGVLTK
jgi:hypothetical protein